MTEAASKLAVARVSASSDKKAESLESLRAFSRLLEESDRFARLVEKAEKYSDMVPPYILEQVQADYRKQKKAVDEKLEKQKGGFRKAYEEHLSDKEVLENICGKLRDRIKELRFRRVVGEYDEEEVQEQIRDLKRQLSESLERLDQMEEILDQYVIIGFDDLIEREDSGEARQASVARESSHEEDPEEAEDACQQEQETPLPMLQEDDAEVSAEKEPEEKPAYPNPRASKPAEDARAPFRPWAKPASYPQGYITVLDGNRKGDRVPLIPADIMLGSSPNTDVMLTDQGISESHARIYFKDRKYFIENLDVLGRSYVNGIQSKVCELHHKDVIRLGNLNLRVDFTPINS
jgi:Inner membrane component of T3SS, cytoplasmic domain